MTGYVRRIVPLVLLLVLLPLWMIRSDRQAEAGFSSSQRIGSNRLTTATVDLTVDRPTTVLTTNALLPGDRHWLELRVTNVGSLPILITANVVPEAGFGRLADVLDLALVTAEQCGEPAAIEGSDVADIRVDVGEATTVCLLASMPLSTANAVQGMTSQYSIVVNGTHDVDR